MTKRSYIKFFIFVLITGSIWYGWEYITNNPVFPIEQVEIYGDYQYADQHELQQVITPYIEKGYFNTNVTELRNALMALPGVRSVSVKKSWPKTVNILIKPKKPFAKWNEAKLLSKDGQIFQPHNSQTISHLPQLQGEEKNVKKITKQYQSLTQVHQSDNPISKLSYTGNQWTATMKNGVVVKLGTENITQRFERFVKYYPKLKANHPDQAVSYFDTRYPQGFAVKWKKIP